MSFSDHYPDDSKDDQRAKDKPPDGGGGRAPTDDEFIAPELPFDDDDEWAPDPRAELGGDMPLNQQLPELDFDLEPPLTNAARTEREGADDQPDGQNGASDSDDGDTGYEFEAELTRSEDTVEDADIDLEEETARFDSTRLDFGRDVDADETTSTERLVIEPRGDEQPEEELEFAPLRLQTSSRRSPPRLSQDQAVQKSRSLDESDPFPQRDRTPQAEDDGMEITSIRRSLPQPIIPGVPNMPPNALVRLYCHKDIYSNLLKHGIDGLPEREGGTVAAGEGAREIKGVLLGAVLELGRLVIVHIIETFPLPLRPEDRNDRCSFGPVEDELIRRHLAELPFCGVVGYYHSHPDHDVFLSPFDAMTLNRRCKEEWQTAVVVQPREREVGFFIKERPEMGGEASFQSGQLPTALVYLDARGRPTLSARGSYEDRGNDGDGGGGRKRRWPSWFGG